MLGRYSRNVTISRSFYQTMTGPTHMTDYFELEGVDSYAVFAEITRSNPGAGITFTADDGGLRQIPTVTKDFYVDVDCLGQGAGACVISIHRPPTFLENARQYLRRLAGKSGEPGTE